MKSDTPRTDLNCLTVETLRTMKGTGTQIVLAAVCRQLERDLNSVVNQWSSDVDRLERLVRKYRAALERIANQDYRGNKSTEQQIAEEALLE